MKALDDLSPMERGEAALSKWIEEETAKLAEMDKALSLVEQLEQARAIQAKLVERLTTFYVIWYSEE